MISINMMSEDCKDFSNQQLKLCLCHSHSLTNKDSEWNSEVKAEAEAEAEAKAKAKAKAKAEIKTAVAAEKEEVLWWFKIWQWCLQESLRKWLLLLNLNVCFLFVAVYLHLWIIVYVNKLKQIVWIIFYLWSLWSHCIT